MQLRTTSWEEIVMISENVPFILKFKTDNNYYIYDINTNRILLVSSAMWEIADKYWDYSKEQIISFLNDKFSLIELEKGYSRVTDLVENHSLLSPKRFNSRIPYLSEEQVAEALSQGLQQLTLEVTESCNMRCRYCAFSGGYIDNRSHGLRQMSFQTAKGAVDLYLEKNQHTDNDLSIGFYGGEPLLQYRLIRKVISYIKSLPISKLRKIRFNLTTNATLLNEEIINFLIEHEVALTISIDGPQPDHDRHRLLKNGTGSFKKVLGAIKQIHNLNPGYFENFVLFNCVTTPTSDLIALNEFFTEHPDYFCEGKLMVSGVTPGNPTFLDDCLPHPTRSEDYQSLFNSYCNTRLGEEENNLTFLSALFDTEFVKIHKRFIREQPLEDENISPSCFAGSRKLFVDVNGKFHICERISGKFPIGDIHAGLDIQRITEVMNEYASIMNQPECLNCKAIRFCNQCFATMASNDEFKAPFIENGCLSTNNNLENSLITYCSVWERKEDAWKFIDDIVLA